MPYTLQDLLLKAFQKEARKDRGNTVIYGMLITFLFIGILEEIAIMNPEMVLVFLVIAFIYQIYFRFGVAFYSALNDSVKALLKVQLVRKLIKSVLYRRFLFASWMSQYFSLKSIYFRIYDTII